MDLVQAIIILIVGYWLAGKLSKATRRWLDRFERVDSTLKPLFANVVRYVVIIITLVAVLAQFGVQTTSIIAVLGAAGLAIGLALQGTLQNIAVGIMLLLLRPFKVGDVIDAAGKMGTVVEISLFSTEFKTPDVICIILPNGSVWGASLMN
jgi:small conductance mechanosensitive channel